MSSNLSRRSFLKGAAALAVVSAASGVLAGCSTVGGSGVSGAGVSRVFKDGENVITVTSTGVNVYNKVGTTTMIVVPTFKVDNQTKSTLYFRGDANNISTYTMAVAATFDGKKPDAAPVRAVAEATSSTSGSTTTTSMPLYGGDVVDFYNTSAAGNKATEGVLAFKPTFTNWEKMVVTMTLYKTDKDNKPVTIGTTTYTFNQ